MRCAVHFEAQHAADTAIAVRLYAEIDGPASRVPISEVLDDLPQNHRATFVRKFAKALRSGLLDDLGVEFLFEQQWIKLDHAVFKRVEKFDGKIARDTYLRRCAMSLAGLQAWAAGRQLILPSRISNIRRSIEVAAPPSSSGRGGSNPIYDRQAIKDEVLAFYKAVGDDGFKARSLQAHLRSKFPKPCAQQLRNIARPLVRDVESKRKSKKGSSIKALVSKFTRGP